MVGGLPNGAVRSGPYGRCDPPICARHQARDELVSTGFIGCREGRVGNSQKFLDTSYARVAELVLGSTPAGTRGVVDGAARDRRLRQLAAIP